MDKNYWLGRWARGETGWHQAEVEPALVSGFSKLGPTRVLVPLCGKSLDLGWLASRGHEVVGVELSELSCQMFFEESGIAVEKRVLGPFTLFDGGAIRILNGDFFELRPEDLGRIGALYDRAALIALPPPLRSRYASKIAELVRSCSRPGDFTMLQVVLERTPHDTAGPPFSVPASELRALYGADFEITPLSRETVAMPEQESGVTEECVYGLTLRRGA